MIVLGNDRGQTTLELALCLPLLALVFGGLVEASMLGVDQLRLWHSAREAARVSAVDPDPQAAREAAGRSGLTDVQVTVRLDPAERSPGRPLTVELSYDYDSNVPVVGTLFDRVVLGAEATMRIERV